MNNRKKTGSYYTPDFLSEFVVNYVAKTFKGMSKIDVFEPSVGDGSFVRAFTKTTFPKNIRNYSFTAVDKVKAELQKAQTEAFSNRKPNCRYSFTKADFLKFQKSVRRKFHLIVGNPPYIKKQLLNKMQLQLCQEIHESADLAKLSIKNIWTSFLVRCCQMLDDKGVLAFVLPAELLQVKFSAELREYLAKTFVRTEIFTFDDLLFDCKGQDTVLLIGFKSHTTPGLFYTNIAGTAQLANREFVLTENRALHQTGFKWTHHLLSSEDLVFIHGLGSRLNSVNHYCDSKPGIVTAANDFFIVNNETETKYNLARFSRPIIQKGAYVNGSVVFGLDNYQTLVDDGLPAKIVTFSNDDPAYDRIVKSYIALGVSKNLPDRHKCKKRKNWYVVPNISTVPQAFFFKRSHQYPKLLKNEAGVLTTDSAYKIQMYADYDVNSLVFSFYNSLTLVFAELLGRYYGGGVLELTPSEFKAVPIPYYSISNRDFRRFVNRFENKNDIAEILRLNDYQILNSVLGLSDPEIQRIHKIYQILTSKRLREGPKQKCDIEQSTSSFA